MKRLFILILLVFLCSTLFNEIYAQSYVDVTNVAECTSQTVFNTEQCTAAFDAADMADNNESGWTCLLYATGFFADSLTTARSNTRFESSSGTRYQFLDTEASAAASCASIASSSLSSSLSSATKSLISIQELQSRKEITNQIVDNIFVADKPTLTSGELKGSASASVTSSYQSISVPLSYAYSSTIQFRAALPIYFLDSEFKMGNISGAADLYKGSFDDQLVLTSCLFELPTGEKEVGSGGINLQISQSRVKDFDETRAYVGYSYRYTAEVDQLDSGDVINVAVGLNSSLDFELPYYKKNYSGYGIITFQRFAESKYGGSGMGDGRMLLDATFGIIPTTYDIRFGLSLPILTLADNFDNADRLISLDFGYRFGAGSYPPDKSTQSAQNTLLDKPEDILSGNGENHSVYSYF